MMPETYGDLGCRAELAFASHVHDRAEYRPRPTTPRASERARHRVRRVLGMGLGLVPIVIVARLCGLPGPALFTGSLLALVPLAWLIGEATEHAAEHTGPVGAALLNASFGNAPELIITLFAVSRGLSGVVRGSLVGSVAGNGLLVLGTALLAGPAGPLPRHEVRRFATLIALACGVFVLTTTAEPRRPTPSLTLLAAAVLITCYAVTTIRSLRAGRDAPNVDEVADAVAWPLRRAMLVLAAATVGTLAVSEALTASIESFARAADVPDLFVTGVLVALAGNAAEHGGAVLIAMRGNVTLAVGIAMASATQVGLMVLPAVATVSLLVRPMALAFRPVELACLAATAIAPAVLLRDGYGSRLRGSALCVAYAAGAVAFLLFR